MTIVLGIVLLGLNAVRTDCTDRTELTVQVGPGQPTNSPALVWELSLPVGTVRASHWWLHLGHCGSYIYNRYIGRVYIYIGVLVTL